MTIDDHIYPVYQPPLKGMASGVESFRLFSLPEISSRSPLGKWPGGTSEIGKF
jgi:hypothetical protein